MTEDDGCVPESSVEPADGFDEDAMLACVDLVGRSGAKGFEVGYLDSDVPADRAGWYAHAQYRGNRIIAEGYEGPVEAGEALARRVLRGGQCVHCKRTVTLAGHSKSHCRWTRNGDKWVRGCGPSELDASRAAKQASDA